VDSERAREGRKVRARNAPKRATAAATSQGCRRASAAGSERLLQVHTGKPMFDELYSDPARLEQFMNAMQGISQGNFQTLAEKYDFSKPKTLCARIFSARATTSRSSHRSPSGPSPPPGCPTA
jgi:hypothetical protein